MTMRRALALLHRDCSGAAAVETVLIMPLAILLLVLGIESGHYLYSEHQVVKGVRDAARFASRLPLSIWNCTAATNTDADLSKAATTPGIPGTVWQAIANVAVYGSVTPTTAKRLWTWSPIPTDGEVVIRYRCDNNGSGIYTATRFAPRITVTGKPYYPSLFKTMTGFTGSMRLGASQQAAGSGI